MNRTDQKSQEKLRATIRETVSQRADEDNDDHFLLKSLGQEHPEGNSRREVGSS
jgi:hypothetical protein